MNHKWQVLLSRKTFAGWVPRIAGTSLKRRQSKMDVVGTKLPVIFTSQLAPNREAGGSLGQLPSGVTGTDQ
jgi:hypothetical protein